METREVMALLTFIVFCLLDFIFLAILISKIRTLKRIIDTPTTSIKDLKPGRHEIIGIANAVDETEIVRSPFSNLPCLCFQVNISQTINKATEQLYNGCESVKSKVSDGTGSVLLDFRHATFVSTKYEKKVFHDKPFIQSLNLDVSGYVDVVESIIMAGEEIYVQGPVVTEAGQYKIMTVERGTLLISDKSESELVASYKLQCIQVGILVAIFSITLLIVLLLY